MKKLYFLSKVECENDFSPVEFAILVVSESDFVRIHNTHSALKLLKNESDLSLNIYGITEQFYFSSPSSEIDIYTQITDNPDLEENHFVSITEEDYNLLFPLITPDHINTVLESCTIDADGDIVFRSCNKYSLETYELTNFKLSDFSSLNPFVYESLLNQNQLSVIELIKNNTDLANYLHSIFNSILTYDTYKKIIISTESEDFYNKIDTAYPIQWAEKAIQIGLTCDNIVWNYNDESISGRPYNVANAVFKKLYHLVKNSD